VRRPWPVVADSLALRTHHKSGYLSNGRWFVALVVYAAVCVSPDAGMDKEDLHISFQDERYSAGLQTE
jgi:hypothetical protein